VFATRIFDHYFHFGRNGDKSVILTKTEEMGGRNGEEMGISPLF